MMSRIKYTPPALKELEEIRDYITNEIGSPEAAKNTLEKITKTLRKLEDFPELGQNYRSQIRGITNFRYIVCGKYIAFYSIEEEFVAIHHIIYGRRDINALLKGKPYREEN